jgi:hypothetical protein
MKGGGAVMETGILRLRNPIRKTNRPALLRMTKGKSGIALRMFAIVFVVWSGVASAATYYVSSSTGNDANNALSASAPWQTIAHVNGQTFQPGDSILFKRGDVWNESSGTGLFGDCREHDYV